MCEGLDSSITYSKNTDSQEDNMISRGKKIMGIFSTKANDRKEGINVAWTRVRFTCHEKDKNILIFLWKWRCKDGRCARTRSKDKGVQEVKANVCMQEQRCAYKINVQGQHVNVLLSLIKKNVPPYKNNTKGRDTSSFKSLLSKLLKEDILQSARQEVS